MTNPDSALKCGAVTLPTKICIVNSIVFPVVMYGCESWTIKEVEHQRIDAFSCGTYKQWNITQLLKRIFLKQF